MEVIILVWIVTSVWVGFDAKSIGARKGLLTGIADMGPLGWFGATLIVWVIGFPLYLANRSRIKEAALRRPIRRGGPFSGR